MTSIKYLLGTGLLILSIVLLAALATANAFQQQPPHQPAQRQPVPVPPTYGGPGDTPPPGSGTGPGCTNPVGCAAPTVPDTCPANSDNFCVTSWDTDFSATGTFGCICDQEFHPVEAYNLTFKDLADICSGGCLPDPFTGNITVAISADNPSVCDAVAILSGWLVPGTFSNMPPTLQAPIPVLACIDDWSTPQFDPTRMWSPGPNYNALGVDCRKTKRSDCLGCPPEEPPAGATVTLTFDPDCMCAALSAWSQHFIAQGITDPSVYENKWILHVAFTHCTNGGD